MSLSLAVLVEPGRLVVTQREGSPSPDGPVVAWDSLAALPEAVTAVCQAAAEQGRKPRLMEYRLALPLVQVRRVRDLPAARTKDLGRLVALNVDRYFRLKDKTLVTDAQWEKRHGEVDEDKPVCIAAAVEESLVESLARATESTGLQLAGIGPEPAPWSRLDLRPPRVIDGHRRRSRLRFSIGLAVAAGLWILAGATYLGRQAAALRRTAAELEAMDGAMQALREAQESYRAARSILDRTRAAQGQRGIVLELLGDIVAVLPDSGYLTGVSLTSEGTGDITGLAPSATQLVEALDVGSFGPELTGLPIRESHQGRPLERFAIALIVGQGGKSDAP